MVRKTLKLEVVQLDQTLFYLNYLQLFGYIFFYKKIYFSVIEYLNNVSIVYLHAKRSL